MKLLALALALLPTFPALSEPLTIAAGKPTGGYDTAAQRLSQRLSQRSIDSTIKNYAGSDEITLALCASKADIGFTQIDAIYTRAIEGCTLQPLGLYGREYAYIFFPPDSPHNELEDLDARTTVLIDTLGSGTDLFWNTIRDIELGDQGNGSDWASASSINAPIDLAPTLAEIGDIDAVILVRKPDDRDIRNLLALGFEQGWIYDKDINDVTFNDRSLYESVDGQTYEVRSFVVAGPNFDKTLTRTVQVSIK